MGIRGVVLGSPPSASDLDGPPAVAGCTGERSLCFVPALASWARLGLDLPLDRAVLFFSLCFPIPWASRLRR